MTATALTDNTMTTGQLVREAAGGFHELLNGSNVTATGSTGWLDKGFVDHATMHIELGACTGTSTSCTFVLEQADDSSGGGAVELDRTPTFDQADDNANWQKHVLINKRYIRLSYTVAGTSPVFPTTATLQTGMYRQDNQGLT